MININNENKEALNQEAEIDNSTIDTPSIEETTEDIQTENVNDESTEDFEAGEGSIETEDSEGSKKGYSARVQQLANERREAEERAKSLEEKLRELTEGSRSSSEGYIPNLQPGQEYTQDQIQQEISKSANALVDLKIKQYEAVNKINTGAMEAVKKYSELDPSSDSFNKELSEAITEATEAYVTKNPYSANVVSFVDKLMTPYKRAVTKEVGQAKETLAKQVSQAAARPTAHRQPEKDAREKSIAELERELGIVNS